MSGVTAPERSTADLALAELRPALERLDRLLAVAAERAREVFGAEQATDRYRGLYISDAEVDRLLARLPGEPLFAPALSQHVPEGRLWWLTEQFELTPFDADVVLLALAPEADLRYERLYAYLQDDVTRRRPSVDLALHLLCRSAEERLLRRAHFSSDGPLTRHQLIELPGDQTAGPGLLSHPIKLDERVASFLLGDDALDRRLVPFATRREPGDLPLLDSVPADLGALAARATRRDEPLRLYLHGPDDTARRLGAGALASALGRSLVEVDVARVLRSAEIAGQLAGVVVRDAVLGGAVLYLANADQLSAPERADPAGALGVALNSFPGVMVLAGSAAWIPRTAGICGVVTVPVEPPGAAAREALWQAAAARNGFALTDETAAALASRFRFTPAQIVEAAHTAAIDGADLFAAARRQSGHALAALARRIEPRARWDDLVLPDDSLGQLREICARVTHRDTVLGTWGFGVRLSRGRGVSALFAGPPGTGKTMAAEIVAAELGFDLYRVELAGVVSKYIGETEKNLDKIFEAAERADGILLFDEADALFGKRSEVHDAHDRYANIEISYLLQRMEDYEGVAILATNLRGNLDAAFLRRLAFTVHFPFPDEPSRRRIWDRVWPADAPVAVDVDYDFLARQFSLSGGNIRNIALAAAFYAATEDGTITMSHLLRATHREYQKLGKTLTAAELGPYAVH